MSQIDACLATRTLIENAFSYLTWHEPACRALGFQGISQVWREEPAWYFWLDKVEGAFLVRLFEEEAIDTSQFVSLAVHYYPPPDSKDGCLLSSRERQIIFDDELFDRRTCTPHFEAFEACLGSFVCAEISLMIDSGNRLQLFLFSADDTIRQPVGRLLDLLVKTLNFEAGQHHCAAWMLKENQPSSLFLVYDENGFERFLAYFGLNQKDLQPAQITEDLEQWCASAHMDSTCSVPGVCSCH